MNLIWIKTKFFFLETDDDYDDDMNDEDTDQSLYKKFVICLYEKINWFFKSKRYNKNENLNSALKKKPWDLLRPLKQNDRYL